MSEYHLGRLHRWDESTDLLAHSVIGYAIERLKVPKDPTWGARPAADLDALLEGTVTAGGIGGHAALRLFRDQLLPATRPLDDPLALAYVPTAPAPTSILFDLAVSASSIFAGHWEAGAGAIAAENAALRWLADLAGLPAGAGGCFVSGGSAANLSALVAARCDAEARGPRPVRWRIAATSEAHASIRSAARVMDVDVVPVAADARGRMSGAALDAALDGSDGVFAVVANGGTTNAGAVDDLAGIAEVCERRGLWLHVDGAYGLAALCAPSARAAFDGIERVDSFGVDPHKWLFAPYDCAALVYRRPELALRAHTQHAEYLASVDHLEWNPSDYAYHLSRRARGLPLWFSLVTHGTDAYRDAVETTLATARAFAHEVAGRRDFRLLLDPQLSVVLFQRVGWSEDDYSAWSRQRAREGVALIVPTTWRDETCYRVCVVNPRTEIEQLSSLLDDMERWPG
jgi:glutamate/tyrosine decarboxylase-like PLP-dependent enzyme